jgi:nucleoside-diphosphate-sugar epimerase
VGSRIAAALAADFNVVAMGRTLGDGGIRWQMGDVGVGPALAERGVAVLVHSAWDMKQTDAAKNWTSNVDGSRQLLDEARASGVSQVVFVSTMSAFEGARSEYGKSKVAVEAMVLAAGGTVVRPGLVWGDRPGGMFGSLRAQVSKGGPVPMIGDGRYAQYLVHEDDLAEGIRQAALGRFPGQVLTLAHEEPWMLRDLILGMAEKEGKKITPVDIPWWLIYGGLKAAETVGVKLGFRSDSLLSLVYQNRAPKFSREVSVRRFGF